MLNWLIDRREDWEQMVEKVKVFGIDLTKAEKDSLFAAAQKHLDRNEA